MNIIINQFLQLFKNELNNFKDINLINIKWITFLTNYIMI